MMRAILGRTVLATLILGMASVASAGEAPRTARPFSPKSLERVAHENQKRGGVPLVRYGKGGRDSVLDGGLIGAGVGGVGGGFLIVAASGGSNDFPRAMINVGALPALGGFALGAWVDSMR